MRESVKKSPVFQKDIAVYNQSSIKMKFFVVFAVAVIFAAYVSAAPSGEEMSAEETALSSAEATDDEVVRAKKSTYGGHGHGHGYGHQESHGYGHGGHQGGHHGGHGYAHAGPAKSYAYHSPAPHVPCGHNLLVGCHPNVAPVPCAAYHGHHGHSYGHHGY